MSLLEVQDLQVRFAKRTRGLFAAKEYFNAVDGVSFNLEEGETLGLVGESGCGKSTTARSIAGLVNQSAGRVVYKGQEMIAGMKRSRQLLGDIQMIFQDPYSSLNPRMTVARIIGEPLQNFGIANGKDALLRSIELMELVGLHPDQLFRYPHEFSGGQKQRIGVARALASNPKILICDEPVSALDVSVQAQILNLLDELQKSLNLSLLFISHDLSVVRHIADRVAVMYQGKIVETGLCDQVIEKPGHDYTKRLLSAIPRLAE